MAVMAMSDAEISRFDTLMRLDRGELRPAEAMQLLRLERSQLYRLLRRLRSDGAAGVISRKRGRPSNRRFSDAFREQVLGIVRERYADFGPTLAAEYLAERHSITLSHETLRQLMIGAGLWKVKATPLLHYRLGRDPDGDPPCPPASVVCLEGRDGRLGSFTNTCVTTLAT
jgi:transposase